MLLTSSFTLNSALRGQTPPKLTLAKIALVVLLGLLVSCSSVDWDPIWQRGEASPGISSENEPLENSEIFNREHVSSYPRQLGESSDERNTASVNTLDSLEKQQVDFAKLKPFAGHTAPISGMYLVDINHILVADNTGVLALWGLGGRGSAGKVGQLPENFTALAYEPTRQLLATSAGGLIQIFSLPQSSSGKLREVYRTSKVKGKVLAMDFNLDGESIILGAADSRVYRWKFIAEANASRKSETDKSFERYVGHNSVVAAVKYHPIGRIFFSGDWSGALNVWLAYDADAHGGAYDRDIFADRFYTDESTRVRGLRAGTDSIDHIAINAGGDLAAVAGASGTIQVYKVRGLKKLAEVQAHGSIIYDMTFAPNGSTIISAGRDGLIRRWDLTTDANQLVTLTKTGEVERPMVQKILPLSNTRLVAGDLNGKVLEIEFQ